MSYYDDYYYGRNKRHIDWPYVLLIIAAVGFVAAIVGFVIYSGISHNIPEGTYTITTDANRNWVYFRVYSDEDYTNEIFSTTPSVNNPIGKIVLKKGMYIEIVRATMTFTVYTGIVFEWQTKSWKSAT